MSSLARPDTSRLLLVDVQEGLAPHVRDGDEVVAQCVKLLGGARVLGVPVVVSEHYPEGLKATVTSLRERIDDGEVYRKDHFSCISDPELGKVLTDGSRQTLVIAGMETHVCVMQSALEARDAGLQVLLVADAVGSRRASDRSLALERMACAGIILVSLEMLLFEWCVRGGTDTFRELHRRYLR